MLRSARECTGKVFGVAVILTSLIVLLSVTSISQAKQRKEKIATSSIVNGNEVQDAGKWPWMAAIVKSSERIPKGALCGGSLIAPNRVLTAEHCLAFKRPSSIDVVLGSGRLSDPRAGQRLDVVGITVHPFLPGTTSIANDVALLTLSEPVNIQPVRLATQSNRRLWSPGQPAIALGRGSTSGHEWKPSDPLREGKLTMLSDSDCEAAMPEDGNGRRVFDPRSMICAMDLRMRDSRRTTTCGGDSGSPLIVGTDNNYFQVGVTSWGDGQASGESLENNCEPRYPSVFARVPALHRFITQPDSDLTFQPFNTSEVQLQGTPKVGHTLTCLPGRWGGDPAPLQYSWLGPVRYESQGHEFFVWEEMPGATSQTYVPKADDVGKEIQCGVTAENAGGSFSAFSDKVQITQ